jgi:hypothetical protein
MVPSPAHPSTQRKLRRPANGCTSAGCIPTHTLILDAIKSFVNAEKHREHQHGLPSPHLPRITVTHLLVLPVLSFCVALSFLMRIQLRKFKTTKTPP